MKKQKYVARTEEGKGWRIFNRKTQRSWGNYYSQYPIKVLEELNGEKRPEVLVKLQKPF